MRYLTAIAAFTIFAGGLLLASCAGGKPKATEAERAKTDPFRNMRRIHERSIEKEMSDDFDAELRKAFEEASGRYLCRSKDCLSCHSLDGTKSDGPTFKRMYSVKQNVSAKGFPPCPAVEEGSLTEAEAAAVIRFIKSVR